MSASSSGSKDTLDRIERMRSKAVYRSMLKLLDNNGIESSLEPIDQGKLWKNTRCMSGVEFELALEERILGGYCGYPGCRGEPARKLEGCCSMECAEGVKKHMAKLGSTDEALRRFTALYELAKKERNMQLGRNVEDTGYRKDAVHAKEGDLAAGTKKVPIMQAVVKERDPVGSTSHQSETPSYDAEAIEGYRVSSKRGVKEKKVHFAETVDVDENNTPQTSKEEEEENTQETNGKATFVFEIEDPKGPIDDEIKSLGDTFGTLKMVSEEMNEAGGIDRELVRTMKQGTSRYFPHLESSLPREIWESTLDTSDDNENEHDYDDDNVSFLSDADLLSDEEDNVNIQCHKTFFTELFSFFDLWITDYTIEYISGKRIIPLDEERKSVPQVPEVMNAMQSFISIACKTLTTSLNAAPDKKNIGDDISKVIYSFRMDQSLPAFQSKQWVVVCLVILKALSLTVRPEYQEYTDTRDGIVRMGKILSDAQFTVEELYAVLDLLVCDTQ
jgi:hypothetical protein